MQHLYNYFSQCCWIKASAGRPNGGRGWSTTDSICNHFIVSMRSKNVFFITQKKARQGMLKFTFFKDAEKGIDLWEENKTTVLHWHQCTKSYYLSLSLSFKGHHLIYTVVAYRLPNSMNWNSSPFNIYCYVVIPLPAVCEACETVWLPALRKWARLGCWRQWVEKCAH